VPSRSPAFALALVLLGAVATSAGASPRLASAPDDPRPAEVRHYWTPERMAGAAPLDLAPPPPPSAVAPSVSLREARSQVDGPSGVVAGEGRSTYAAVQIADTAAPGIRTHGKLFFTKPGIGDFVCSGTVVNAPNESTVWTAGHCVYESDTATYSTNFLFVPGYDEGAAPFGEWTAVDAYAAPGYVGSADLRDDVGALKMQVKQRAKTVAERATCSRFNKRRRRRRCRRRLVLVPIQDKVGARGIAFNQDETAQTFNAFGYPVVPGPRFDGQHLELCTSPLTSHDPFYSDRVPIAIECDMRGGSSGGGWVISGGRVNGTVSYGRTGFPNELFSPYFDSVIRDFYDAVKSR
jgi:hypothetical protein